MLTEHQEQKLNESLDILKKGDRLLIKGKAGVGKTFLCNELVKRLLLLVPYYIYCTAPTNKAVAVLQSKITADGKLAYMSTHAALKMKRVINEETGEISFEPIFSAHCPPLQNVSVLIVDEASMVGKELLKHIENWATIQHCKVIFLMDYRQLPPVEEEEMSVLLKDYPSVELMQIIRQKNGNPIIDLSLNLGLLKKKEDRLIQQWDEAGMLPVLSEGYVFSNDFEKIINRLILSNGTDLYKYGAYTNAEVNRVNLIVRKKLYGEEPKRIEIGETMIFDAPYGQNYKTNDEIKIERCVILQNEFKYLPDKNIELKYYLINYLEVKGVFINGVLVLHEDSDEDFKKVKKILKDSIKAKESTWASYYNFVEQFAQLKYNHALTIHKAQGSTYQNMILNLQDMRKCKSREFNHLLYTGITRASKMVVLYNA